MKFYLFRNDKAIVLENPGKGKFQSWFKGVTLKNIVVVHENMSSVSFKAGTSYDKEEFFQTTAQGWKFLKKEQHDSNHSCMPVRENPRNGVSGWTNFKKAS